VAASGVRRFRVVIGARPARRLALNPGDFLGSYILPITAHSNVLLEFGGGDGRVDIHGRGGASLLDRSGPRAATAAYAWRTGRSSGSSARSARRAAGHPGTRALDRQLELAGLEREQVRLAM
jgi:hypothetical protein